MSSNNVYNTIVIGGGQAGLAAGFFLSRQDKDKIILDETNHTGYTWRKRWDSLRLFTPSQNNGLLGMKFPKPDFYFPSKDEAADFLEAYASQFSLPVQNGVRVDQLQRNESGYQLSAGGNSFHAKQVIIVTGAFYTPRIPSYSDDLNESVFQLHSANYHNPMDVPGKNVVVVGAGNSGAEIAIELAKDGRKAWLAGRDVGRIPADKLGRILGDRPYGWFLRHVMTIHTPLGRRMKTAVLNHGNPLIRIHCEGISAAGVDFTPRISGARDGKPLTEDGRILPADAVVWATGFRPDYHWMNLPIFDEAGRPRHVRGVVPEAPGIFFLGLHFQTGLTSSLLGGVGADARYITRFIQ